MGDLFGHYRLTRKLLKLYKSIRIKNPSQIVQIETDIYSNKLSYRDACSQLVSIAKLLLSERYLDNYLETILKYIIDEYEDLLY